MGGGVDEEAFSGFYTRSVSRLTAQLFLMLGDWEEARDCVQEAYARAWVRWSSLDGDDPDSWVRTVAWRIAVSRFRRTLAHRRALGRHGVPADVPEVSPDQLVVRDALRTLPSGQRAALVLHYYEQLSVGEIAKVLGITAGGVKARLSRGRQALLPLVSDVPRPSRGNATAHPRGRTT